MITGIVKFEYVFLFTAILKNVKTRQTYSNHHDDINLSYICFYFFLIFLFLFLGFLCSYYAINVTSQMVFFCILLYII